MVLLDRKRDRFIFFQSPFTLRRPPSEQYSFCARCVLGLYDHSGLSAALRRHAHIVPESCLHPMLHPHLMSLLLLVGDVPCLLHPCSDRDRVGDRTTSAMASHSSMDSPEYTVQYQAAIIDLIYLIAIGWMTIGQFTGGGRIAILSGTCRAGVVVYSSGLTKLSLPFRSGGVLRTPKAPGHCNSDSGMYIRCLVRWLRWKRSQRL